MKWFIVISLPLEGPASSQRGDLQQQDAMGGGVI